MKSLVSSLQTKYALKGYNVEATALEAAGGKESVTTGKDILVTLPAYRFTSTPETDNTRPIEVTAEDVKGNLSNREQSMVVVQAPTKPERFLGIVKYPNIERGFPFNRHTDFYCA